MKQRFDRVTKYMISDMQITKLTRRLVAAVGLVAFGVTLNSCGGDDDIKPGGGGGEASLKLDAYLYTPYIFGVYEKGVALTEDNYLLLNVYANEAGKYDLSTKELNGYKFTASGEFESAGDYEVKLMAEGTPENDQIDSIFISSATDDAKVGIPVLSGLSNRIILASGGDSFDGIYSTLAISGRGELLWEKPGICPVGAVDNDVFYYAGKEALTAVDVKTGTVKWERDSLANMARLTFADDVLYVGSYYSDFYAVNTTSGEILWKYDPGISSIPSGAPVLGESHVYFTVGSTIHAVQKSDGAFVWEGADVGNSGTPFLSGDQLYVAGGFDGVAAISTSDGSAVWQIDTRSEGSPKLKNGFLYVNGYEMTYCLNPDNGTEVWSTAIEYLDKSPLFVDDKILVTTDFGFTAVYALDAANGEILWDEGAVGFSETELVSQGGLLYIGASNSLGTYHLEAGEQVLAFGGFLNDGPLAIDYSSILAVYDTDSKETAYPPNSAH